MELSEREKQTILCWLETGAPYAGTYAALGTAVGGQSSGAAWPIIRQRCGSCHNDSQMRLPTDPKGVAPHYYRDVPADAARFATPLLFNESRPEKSLVLLAPLAKEAGGYGSCPGPVFKDKTDPDYQKLLGILQKANQDLAALTLHHMPGFRPNEHYIREMKRYGILPNDLPDDAPVDPYLTDQAYWRSMWHAAQAQ